MGVLSGLEPKKVFQYFEEICAIPHGSFHTKQLSDYLAAFAKERGLAYRQEASNNVIIWKDATPGYENAPVVMLQGHIDMVAEKDPGCPKDMEKEGLDLFVEGDVIGARGTTLGGDDGIAAAMALAILDSDDIPHGPLECVFTDGEEVGMIGAHALDASDLKAKYLLNLDSEAEGVLTVSCAGSSRLVCDFALQREAFDGTCCSIRVEGLQGGHSGEEIQIGRANANILMGRVLTAVSRVTTMRLVTVNGGSKDNAIPVWAEALVVVEDPAKAGQAVRALEAAARNEYRTMDPGVTITVKEAARDRLPADAKSTAGVACFLFCAPNGVQNMSAEVPGLVQTSLNMGVVVTEGDTVSVRFMPRSSVNSQKDEVNAKVTALAEALGAKVDMTTSYSAWEYRKDSPLRDIMVETYRDLYGKAPKVEALHAGLECGILNGKMPELDCISFGPDMENIHTPRERLHIASTERVWKLTLETLKRLR